MNESPLDQMATLSAIWESYAQLVHRRSEKNVEQKLQQRRLILDRFLSLFIRISLEQQGNITIGEMRNVANELSQEFMRNVDSVTRNLNEEDAIRSLEDYMLRGRGWMLLHIIDWVGVKGVSQRHDLCQVLLNLLPYCSHLKPSSPADVSDEDTSMNRNLEDLFADWHKSNAPLSSCFQLVAKGHKLKQLGHPILQSRRMQPFGSSASQLNKLHRETKKSPKKSKEVTGRKRLTKSTPSKKSVPLSDTEDSITFSESGVSHMDERRSKQPRLKRGMRTHMWSSLNKDEESETDDEYVGLITDIETIPLTITGYHLVSIIIKILRSLGELDVGQNIPGRALSATILPHLLYLVTQFQVESLSENSASGVAKTQNWLDSQRKKHDFAENSDAIAEEGGINEATTVLDDEVEVAPWRGVHKVCVLKQAVRAVLSLSCIVVTQQNGVRILHNLKVMDTLLDLKILDSMIPCTGKDLHPESGASAFSVMSQTNGEAGVATDMLCGVVQLLQSIYATLPFNPSHINDANCLASKLSSPDVSMRIRHMIAFCELRAYQMEKTPSVSEVFDHELTASGDSSKYSGHEESTLFVHQKKEESVVNCLKNGESDQDESKSSFDENVTDSASFERVGVGSKSKVEDKNQTSHRSTADSRVGTWATPRVRTSLNPVLDPSSDPVRCLGMLITTLKSVKTNYIHSIKCLKRRHRNCMYGHYYDHHHDILGIAHYTNTQQTQYNEDADLEQSLSHSQEMPDSGVSKPSALEGSSPVYCVVGELASILLDSLSEASFKSCQVHLLSTIRSVGVCCCLQPERIISTVVPQLTSFSPAVRNYALDTLTSLLLDQFQGAQEDLLEQPSKGASGITTANNRWEKWKEPAPNESVISIHDSTRCVHCYLEGSSPLLAGLPTTMDSGFSSCDIEEMRRQRLLERWKSLRLLRKNITSKDESIALTCAKHLMTLAIRGNNEIKEELFFGVYLHVLHMKVTVPGHTSLQRMVSEDVSVVLDRTQTILKNLKIGVSSANESEFQKSASVMMNSEESLLDSAFFNDVQTSTEISSAEDTNNDNSVPSSIMLFCVSALPYVLQVDKVMSIFLARDGLAKLTKLLEYNQLRAPVMSVFEALVMIDERRLRGRTSNAKSVYEGGGVIQTFIDTLAKRTCTVTATLQQISLQSTKDQKHHIGRQNSSYDESKEIGQSATSQQDAELSDRTEKSLSPPKSDAGETTVTSGEVPERTDTLIPQLGRMEETLPILLDMWKTCAKLCMNSRMFRACYRDSPCLYVVQETLVLALSLLGEICDPSHCPGYDLTTDEKSMVFNHQTKLEFIEAVMMVCFSCHTIFPSQKRGQEDELWLRLNSALKSCIHLESFKLSAVFQMLLNVALPRCPSILEYSYAQIVSMLNLREKEDVADEDEVRKFLQQGIDEDGDNVYTERGYDADTECSVHFDWKKGLEDSLKQSAMCNYYATTSPCFPAVFRLFVELMVACHCIAGRGVILQTVALRLLQTLRSSRRAVQAVCSENLLEVLIDGFREILVRCPVNGKQSTLQEIILSLIQVIAQNEVSASELRQFLRLFQDNTITTNSLLSTLLAIIENSPVAPTRTASFPVKTLMHIDTAPLRGNDSDDNVDTPKEQIVWHYAAIEMDVPGVSWPPCQTGFTVALWMCVDIYGCKNKKKRQGNPSERGTKASSDLEENEVPFSNSSQCPMNECLLVVAVGNSEKMFEVWVHPRTASTVIRLTTSMNEAMVLREICLDHLLTPDKWQLLVISYIDVLDGSTFVGKLTVLVDGWLKKEFILDHPASLNRRQQLQRPFLCVGDARHEAAKFHTGTWKLATLRLFKGVNLSTDWWLHLYCLGPDWEGISKCDCGDLMANYTPALLKHVVTAGHLTWDVLVGMSQLPDKDLARTSQVLVYKSSQPEVYSTFSTPHAPAVLLHDDLGLVPHMGSLTDLLTQKPVVLVVRMRGHVKMREVHSLEKAVDQAGGIEAFLFLVAKIFEDSRKAVDEGGNITEAEQLQSKAVHILFQLVHHFPSLALAFDNIQGYSLLGKVLTSSKSIVGYHLLKVLLDAATTESVFKSSATSPNPVLRNQSEAVIRDVEILNNLLLHWRVWHKAEDIHVTSMLFGALESLVGDSHPHKAFNLREMQAGGVMSRIFNIYLERIQDGQPSLPVGVSQSASKVIQRLLGSPPDLHLLMEVMDFLLLVHPAPSGFISFTPGSFYFKLWWECPRVQASSHSKVKKRKTHYSDSDIVTSKLNKNVSKNEGDDKKAHEPVTIQYSLPKSVKIQYSLSQPSVLSDSQAESRDEEGREFQFPPLCATNRPVPLEQSLDRDADQEESDSCWKDSRARSQSQTETLSRASYHTTPDLTSSGAEMEGTLELDKASSREGFHIGAGKEPERDVKHFVGEENPETAHQIKLSSPKKKLMYTESPSEKLSVKRESTTLSDDIMSDGSKQTIDEREGGEEKGNESVKSVESDGREESGEIESDEGLMALCVSLVEYLTQIVLEFPQPSLDDVFSKVVSPKSLLVLAKNPSGDMRLSVMKLLGAYLCRAPSSLIESFIKMDGFYLLANQLRAFPVTVQQIEVAVSIFLRQEFCFDENYMLGDIGETSSLQQAAPVLFLSFLDATACEPDLCRNSLNLLSQLLESTPTMSSLLLDLGLAETMCNLATNLQRRYHGEPTPEEEELTRSLLVDVQHVLCSCAVSEFSWTGSTHYIQVEDMLCLLKALEDQESSSNSGEEACKKRADTARAFQISLVVKILEYVEKRSEELTHTPHGWFTSSSSTMVSHISAKARRPVSRHPLSSSFSTLSSNSTSSTQSMHSPWASLRAGPNAVPTQLPKALPILRRSTFSSPEMMGFLTDTSNVEESYGLAPQHDSDSSSSARSFSSHLASEGGNKPSRFGSIFSRRRKMIYATLSQSELLERFRKILVVAADLAVMFPRTEVMRPQEQRTLNFFSDPKTPSLEDRYLKHLLATLYRFYEFSLNKEVYARKNRNPVMLGAKDVLRIQFTRLFLCIMSLKVDFEMRAYGMDFIMAEQKGSDAIKAIITDKFVTKIYRLCLFPCPKGQELSFYLYNLLNAWKDWLNPAQRETGFSLMQILRRSGFNINSPDTMLTQMQVNNLMEEKKQIDLRYRKDFALWLQKREIGTARVSSRFEAVLRRVTEQAMGVTQAVTHLQIEERKKLVTHIKRAMTIQIQLKKQWQEIVQALTHERAVWYTPSSYPQSWRLDPTEGPGRVRKRLQRCHLGIDKRFLLPQHQVKLDSENVDPPLLFLFEDDHQMSDSAALIYRLYTNEKIQHTCRCITVSPASESKGELLVGEVCLFFVADGAITGSNYTQLLLGNLDQLYITWPHTDIRELHKRWYQLQDVGLEIFLISGRTCLLAFQSTQDRDELYTILRGSLELPNLIAGETLQAVQQAWLEGEVTNYDYLMHLNKLAGRSYTDLMQYPVFPFVLKDYSSAALNLADTKVFRNLRKPIAVQEKRREKRYRDNYEFLCQEAARPNSEEGMMRVAPFHYGSHYSNSGTVLHYMVRLPPFTRMFLSYQDSNFDIPDRTFHSLATSWRLSSFESSTDVKELIPEFFFLPEFLENREGFNFGQRQNGERVHNVSLPPWCEHDARLFVLIHRQALESAFVSANLNAWIDLVFGYKQQGEEAVKAINVFHPSTYFGIDASGIKEPLKRQALLTMIKTYGQTPKQLFNSPHPSFIHRLPPHYTSADERRRAYVPRPVPNVMGLHWGNYLGSLDLAPPVSHDLVEGGSTVFTKLVALPTGLVFGVERNASILLLHGKQRDMAVRSTDVMWAGVINWGYHDNVARIRSYLDKPLVNFMPLPTFGKITCIESVPDCRLLFMAGSAGIINIYTMTHNSSKLSSLQVRGSRKTLYGHSGPITCLEVCQAFSVLVSGSQDGTIIIWDLNRLTYIRSISSHCAEISKLTISDTLGDIASTSQIGPQSCSLQLHTINATYVTSQEVSDIITCLAYSTAPEGRSVNVIAGGLESGAIRLWSSWDLTPLRDLHSESQVSCPVISVTFSADSQYLFAARLNGSVVLWDKDVKSLRHHADRFIPVISSSA